MQFAKLNSHLKSSVSFDGLRTDLATGSLEMSCKWGWSMSDNAIYRIVEELEYLRAKRAHIFEARVRFLVVHGHHHAVQGCSPGETIDLVYLVVWQEKIQLRLSSSALLIADLFARNRLTALTAAQIERIISSDPFYVRLGANAGSAVKKTIRPSHRTIKVYVERLRTQIGKALRKAGLAMAPDQILVSEGTDLRNVKAYRLAVPCEFIHGERR
jgi:hypothetical protein